MTTSLYRKGQNAAIPMEVAKLANWICSEMMSGLGIQSEYIAFAGFCTSIGMAAFSPFFYDLVCIRREKMMCIVGFLHSSLSSVSCVPRPTLCLYSDCAVC